MIEQVPACHDCIEECQTEWETSNDTAQASGSGIHSLATWVLTTITMACGAVAIIQRVHVDSAVPLGCLQLIVIVDAAFGGMRLVVTAGHVRVSRVELQKKSCKFGIIKLFSDRAEPVQSLH